MAPDRKYWGTKRHLLNIDPVVGFAIIIKKLLIR